MNDLEVVGAIIDFVRVSTDLHAIDACKSFGMHVEYICRTDACHRAEQEVEALWRVLAKAPTLFLYVDGRRYYPLATP